MNVRQIEAFLAAYEEGSLSRAAARLGVAQPSLSVLMRDFEADLDVVLFERSTRGIAPTAAAADLYPRAQAILRGIEAARGAIAGGAGRLRGRIDIGLPPTLAKGVLPEVLACYTAEHPEVEVRIAEAFSGTLTEWTLAGEVDCAIVVVPPSDPRLTFRRIGSEPIVLVSAPGAATGDAPIRLADGPPLKLVLPSARHSLRHVLDAEIRAGRIPVGRRVEIDGLTGMLEFVRRTDWVTLLSTTAAARERAEGRLAVRRLADGLPDLEFFVVHRAHRAMSRAAGAFVARIEASLAAARSGEVRAGEGPPDATRP